MLSVGRSIDDTSLSRVDVIVSIYMKRYHMSGSELYILSHRAKSAEHFSKNSIKIGRHMPEIQYLQYRD